MNKLDIFGKLLYKDKIYLILLSDFTKVLFACLENEKVRFYLNDDELKMMKELYSSLLINEKKSALISKETINQTTYNIFYNPYTDFYFWKDLDNNYVDNYTDNIFLNNKYNSRPIVVYLKQQNDKTDNAEKYYSRLTKRKGILMLAASVALSSLPIGLMVSLRPTIQKYRDNGNREEQAIVDIHEEDSSPDYIECPEGYIDYENFEVETAEIVEENTSNEPETQFNIDEIMQIIEENQNIDEDTKNFLYNLNFVFEEYHQYMDIELVKERLKTLKIIYDSNYFTENINIKGMYDPTENTITVYEQETFDINNRIFLEQFIHEFCHVLQANYSNFTFELSNQLFTEEALRKLVDDGIIEQTLFPNGFGGYKTGYFEHLYLYKYLAAILPKETLAKYQFQVDENIIIDALYKIDEEKGDCQGNALKLMCSFQELKDESMFSSREESKKVKEEINYFYKLVKGIDIAEDLNACMDHIPFSSKAGDPLGSILFKELGLDYSEDSEYVLANSIHAIGQTYFSDTHTTDGIISFIISKTYNADDSISVPPSWKRFNIEVTPHICEEYRQKVQEQELSTLLKQKDEELTSLEEEAKTISEAEALIEKQKEGQEMGDE